MKNTNALNVANAYAHTERKWNVIKDLEEFKEKYRNEKNELEYFLRVNNTHTNFYVKEAVRERLMLIEEINLDL